MKPTRNPKLREEIFVCDFHNVEHDLYFGPYKFTKFLESGVVRCYHTWDLWRFTEDEEWQRGPVAEEQGDKMEVTYTPNTTQVGGTHYQTEIQPWDFIVANNLGYLEGNVIKYVVRYKSKNGVEDLKKARHYLDKLIDINDK